MYENIFNYFIECVNTEAKEKIRIEGRIDGRITDKVTPLNFNNINEFFFSRGKYAKLEHIEIELDDRLKWFLNSKNTTYYSENLYLSLEFIEKYETRENKEYKILYPLYFVEVSFTVNTKNAKISLVDYEPYFNLSLFDGHLSEDEKNQIREDINNTELWSNKVAIFKNNLPESVSDRIKQAPLLFIASIPKFYEWVSKELEFIKNRFDNSINSTALKYFLSSTSIDRLPNSNFKYIEIFELNREQENAVIHSLNSSFTVITGPPGTGKSQVVLNLLANLYYNKKTVLFASKNNKAVNTVLEKLENLNTYYFPFIRLGNRKEKSIGKQKILKSLQRPNSQIALNVSHDEIINLKNKISELYESIDRTLIQFRKFHESSKHLEEKIYELENYKSNYANSPYISGILEFIDKTNNKSNTNYDSLLSIFKKFWESSSEFNKQYLKCVEFRKKIDISLAKIIEANPKILIPLQGKDNLKLQRFKKELELWLNNEVNFFKKLVYSIFRSHYENKYLNRYRELFSKQDNEIQDFFFKLIKRLDFKEYFDAVSLFEKSFDYSIELKDLFKQKRILSKEIFPSLCAEFDKLFFGFSDELKKVFLRYGEDKQFIELLKFKRDLFKKIIDYVGLIIAYNSLFLEMKNRYEKVSLYENKNDVDKKLSNYKKQIVEKSVKLFDNHLIESIQENKPSVRQAVKDYFDRWRDNELMDFYTQLRNKFGIWVTTNLSTTYNIPNRPHIFDYVIIDEASQNDMASVIPLLFRAKNAVIIGDPNQLRHITSLKDSTIYEIAKRADVQDGQLGYFHYVKYSAFDLAKKRYIDSTGKEPIHLRNHYRSYSDIIRFANTIVQDYKLFPKTFIRSNIENANIPIGIHWVNVEGHYRNNNTNIEEANAIISFLNQRRNSLSKISVGIITPFSNQAQLISEKLNRANLHKIDVNKNIIASTVHKFQGDERDVILYSPVISNEILNRKERTLKWANNQTNLLNVAITRSRSSLIIFGNMDFCSQIDGLHKVLLDYVNSISNSFDRPEFLNDPSGIESFFYNQLVENGFEFEYQVPVDNGRYILDFVLKADDHFVNIELDGRQHLRTISQDNARDNRMRELGYEVFRFSNEYVRENITIIINFFKKICSLSYVQ